METTSTSTPVSSEQFKITGDWKIQSKNLKAKFSQLTDGDLQFEAGKENELLQRMEVRLNKKRDEVIDLIKKAEEHKN
jgi:hypothetical protein